jgi:hypothetical protein
VSEVEIVLDERSTGVGVIADAVSAHPGIEHGQREKKEHEEKAFRFAWSWLRRRGQTLRLRKRRLHETAPRKLAPKIRIARNRKIRVKNKALFRSRYLFAPREKSVLAGSIISF